MKTILLGAFSFCLLLGNGTFAQTSLADASNSSSSQAKAELSAVRAWIHDHPHIKYIPAQDFMSRTKTERDYMMMHGVLVFDGETMGMDDIQRFNQGQMPERVKQFLNEEAALNLWLQMHPNVRIVSRERYETMQADDRAAFDALTDKIIYNGDRLLYSDVMNH